MLCRIPPALSSALAPHGCGRIWRNGIHLNEVRGHAWICTRPAECRAHAEDSRSTACTQRHGGIARNSPQQPESCPYPDIDNKTTTAGAQRVERREACTHSDAHGLGGGGSIAKQKRHEVRLHPSARHDARPRLPSPPAPPHIKLATEVRRARRSRHQIQVQHAVDLGNTPLQPLGLRTYIPLSLSWRGEPTATTPFVTSARTNACQVSARWLSRNAATKRTSANSWNGEARSSD